MKKLIALLLVLAMVFTFAACTKKSDDSKDAGEETKASEPVKPSEGTTDETKPSNPSSPTAMTFEEYLAAEEDEAVEVECYVQATQSWYNNAIVVYAQDENGGYFAYNMACSEEDAAKLTPGTKINIKGYKTFYKGMPEIAEGATFTIVDSDAGYIAQPQDMTSLLGSDELVNKAGMRASFKGLTIAKIEYRNGEPGDDIYVDFTLGDKTYSFCVERYLTGPETDVYKAFADLQVGDKVDVEGFVYWYEGINTHITSVKPAAMTAEEYIAAAEDEAVVVECYVQATQSWYNNAIVVYAQDENGGYFAYNMACSEEDAAKLIPGTKIRISGYKTFYKGMPEIAAGATFTIVEGADPYIAEAQDMTSLLGSDELVNKAGMLASFKGLTIAKIEYRNGEPGDDIYVDFTLGDKTYSFCVERYLTGPETDVYKAFADLKVGDKVDVEGFVYWYEGINTHITSVKAAE